MNRNRLITVGSRAAIVGYLRRVLRWYSSPSGLLLASSLLLLALGFLEVGPSSVFQTVAVIALGIFLPYRFSRQQGVAARRSEAVDGRVSRLEGRLQRQQAKSQRQMKRLMSETEALAEVSVRSEQELYRRLAGQAGRLSAISETVAANSEAADRIHSASLVVDEVSKRLGDMAAQIERLEARLTSIVTGAESRLEHQDARFSELGNRVDALESRAGTVAALQADVVESAAALARVENQVDELVEPRAATDSSESAELTETTTLITTEISRLRSDIAMWSIATRPDREQFNHLALIVSPQRCGTTWTFDMVRSLPGTSQMASRFIYEMLDIRGNRYPPSSIEHRPQR